MRKIIFCIAFLLNSLNTNAQIKFLRTIGGGDNIYGTNFCLCHDSGYALCAATNFGAYVMRFDKYGDTLWTKVVKNTILTNTRGSHPNFIIETKNHGFAVTSREDDAARYFLLDSIGNFLKERAWTGEQYLGAFFELPGIGYVVSQRGTDCCPSDPHGSYFKMDTSDQMIMYRYLQEGSSRVGAFIKANDGGYVTVGTGDISDSSFITKYEGSTGPWRKYLEGNPISVITLSNSKYLVNAYWQDSLMAYHRGLILTDSLGNTLWKNDATNLNYGHMTEITTPGQEGFALLTEDYRPNYNWENNNNGFKLVKTDLQGNVLWVKHFEGKLAEEGSAIISLADGGFAIVGTTDNYGPFKKILFIRTDSAGNTQ